MNLLGPPSLNLF